MRCCFLKRKKMKEISSEVKKRREKKQSPVPVKVGGKRTLKFSAIVERVEYLFLGVEGYKYTRKFREGKIRGWMRVNNRTQSC